MKSMEKVFGLTGGVASGKSTVSKILSDLGATIIDADLITRQITQPGTPGLNAISEAFGSDFIVDGQVDRKALGSLVFNDKASMETLNKIMFPLIDEEVRKQAQTALESGAKVVIYDGALLVEAGVYRQLRGLVVVVTDRETQIKRMASRNGLSRSDAEARIDSQLPQDAKIAVADWIIENNGSLDDLEKTTKKIFDYLTVSTA